MATEKQSEIASMGWEEIYPGKPGIYIQKREPESQNKSAPLPNIEELKTELESYIKKPIK